MAGSFEGNERFSSEMTTEGRIVCESKFFERIEGVESRTKPDQPRRRAKRKTNTRTHNFPTNFIPRPLRRLFSDNGRSQSAIALSGGVQGGNNAVIDAALARSRRYGAPARGITLKVPCQRNARPKRALTILKPKRRERLTRRRGR